MMENELCSSRIFCNFRVENGEEELSVLPRHTKVVVTGNNRTKSVLVGLQGVVKKAVGLGGWHWLVLKNGVEVKLQRNALSVLEHPTGNEDDDENDDSSSGSEIANGNPFHGLIKPRVRSTRPWVSSASTHLNGNTRRVDLHAIHTNVNLGKLRTECLWRYCKYFNLVSMVKEGIDHTSSREELLKAVRHHFESKSPLDPEEVINGFVRSVKKKWKRLGSVP